MSATYAAEKRTYRCKCGGFLCESAATRGVIEGVFCRRCGKRQSVTLGGAASRAGAVSAENQSTAIGGVHN